ncbi:M48 family metallopeptidase [Pedobacter sp.]|uniref:M48 family metallopeptidase n=1 Tax=Pedobacter sp. TaxID=1411316 RepID=UPI0031D727BB
MKKSTSYDLTSSEFKKAARKAILAIIFFMLSYLLLFALSIGLVVLCGALGIGLIALKPSVITLGLGIGLIGLGVIVFVFLVKFIFKKHKIDRSHLIELTEEDAPLLYEEIRDIVDKVQTTFPKKIYLSHEVNACVFYDSTFLSMFLPVKKNLQIGMALVNSTSRTELKAILAHEFGHFSQRSMKVGSYVYTVNQIIFNMLYDNEGYGNAVQRFANVSGYFAFFVAIGVKIIEGIQWVLKKLYHVVNIQHLELSREMEFHADAIAVTVVGSQPFVSSLMRLDLANNAFDRTLSYYEQKISANVKPKNIYPQHRHIMNALAQDSGIDFVNDMPQVTKEYLNHYNKSKLVIKNQWASHPSTEDRVDAITSGSFPQGDDNGEPALVLFGKADELQATVTELLFANVEYKGQITFDEMASFVAEYEEDFKAGSFPKAFNGYYNNYNPSKFDLEQSTLTETILTFDELFGTDKVDMIYSAVCLETDIMTIKQIHEGDTEIKTFEYDGVKYVKTDIYELLPKLEKELLDIKAALVINDESIYHYFKQEAAKNSSGDYFTGKYQTFLEFDKIYDEALTIYNRVADETSFIQITTPFAEIRENLLKFARTESQLKTQMTFLLALPYVNVDLALKEKVDAYLSKHALIYFTGNSYNDDELEILFGAANAFKEILYQNYFEVKKNLLEEMARLHAIRVAI